MCRLCLRLRRSSFLAVSPCNIYASFSAIFNLPSVGQKSLICSHGVSHDIRKPIDRCWGLHECVVVDPAQPVSDRVVGDQKVATRFRFVPAAHGAQLQDRHAFQAGVLRSPIGRNSPHARTVDAQLFTQHRHFGFELVDSGVWRITVFDQRFAGA
jgi:hypothetical protein